MRRRAFVVGVFLLVALSVGAPAALAGGGCHGGDFKDARGVKVDLVSACFSPTVIRIDPGQRVTWTNRDSMAHTVTGAAFRWGTADDLGLDQAVSFRFQSSGVYPYFCVIHPGMVGAVVVGDGTSSSTTTQDVVPVVDTPAPPTPAAQPATSPAAARGVSQLWRVAAIVGFALFIASAIVLAARLGLGRSRREAARA